MSVFYEYVGYLVYYGNNIIWALPLGYTSGHALDAHTKHMPSVGT